MKLLDDCTASATLSPTANTAQQLVAAWPDGVARDDISDATGYKRSTRDTYLQRLRARKLVTNEHETRAADNLFDEGRR